MYNCRAAVPTKTLEKLIQIFCSRKPRTQLLPFVLLNFRGGQHYSDKIPARVSSVREFWLSLKDSGQREAALLCQGSHTQISRKQPLPFLSPRRVPAGSQPVLSALRCWMYGWCHCGPPRCGLSLHKHTHFSLQSPTADPGHGNIASCGLDLHPREALQMRCQLLLNSPLLLWATQGHFCLCCLYCPLLGVKGGNSTRPFSVHMFRLWCWCFGSTRRLLLTAWNCGISTSGVICGLRQGSDGVHMPQMLWAWPVTPGEEEERLFNLLWQCFDDGWSWKSLIKQKKCQIFSASSFFNVQICCFSPFSHHYKLNLWFLDNW